MAAFQTVADVMHRLIDLAGWREESHAVDAHAVIERELGNARGAGSKDTSSPRMADGPKTAEGPKAAEGPAAPEGAKSTSSPAASDGAAK